MPRSKAVPTADIDDSAEDMGEPNPAGLNSRIKSVVLTIRILNEIAAVGGPIGVSDLARRLGEAKARIHRHLLTLRDAGLLSQGDSDDRYRLGWALFELGQAAAAQFDIAAIAEPAMRQLRDATRLTTILSQRTGDEMIVTQSFDSESMIAVTVRKGMRVPAHRSAMGRIMLAFATAEDQKRILATPLPGIVPGTTVDRAAVRSRLPAILETLLESSRAETQFGVDAIAAPILDSDDKLVAVVSILGTGMQIGEPVKPELITLLRKCSATISGALNSTAYDRLALRA
jgi:IclR family KDG regulon transcriptional repressor